MDYNFGTDGALMNQDKDFFHLIKMKIQFNKEFNNNYIFWTTTIEMFVAHGLCCKTLPKCPYVLILKLICFFY